MNEQEIREEIEKEFKNACSHCVAGGLLDCENCRKNWNLDQLISARMEIEKLKANLKEIPCTCIDAYKDRGLVAPDCPRCNYVGEELLEEI